MNFFKFNGYPQTQKSYSLETNQIFHENAFIKSNTSKPRLNNFFFFIIYRIKKKKKTELALIHRNVKNKFSTNNLGLDIYYYVTIISLRLYLGVT